MEEEEEEEEEEAPLGIGTGIPNPDHIVECKQCHLDVDGYWPWPEASPNWKAEWRRRRKEE